jgi:hypothetical protein
MTPTDTPADIITAYVNDVARRLPAKQRNDVGFELRTLLEDQLREHAGDAGRLPDEAMTLDILRAFGPPDEVAARYGKPGLTIIEPVYADRFIKLAWGGLALQWLLTFPMIFGYGDALIGLSRWWLSWGIGAFWWPGFLVTAAIIAAWARRRWPTTNTWHPKIVDRDRINRSLTALGAGLIITAAAFMAMLPSIIAAIFPPAAQPAFVFDQQFWTTRAPWILPLWGAHAALLVWLVAHGRWTPRARWIEAAINLAVCAVLAWWMAAGPVFEAPNTDSSTKAAFGLIIVLVVIQLVLMLRRAMSGVRPPAALAGRA